MQRHYHCNIVPVRYGSDSIKYVKPVSDIQIRSRFIEDQHTRLLAYRARQHNTLSLSVTDPVKESVSHLTGSRQIKSMIHCLLIRFLKFTESAGIRIPAHCHHFTACHHPRTHR